MTLFTPNAVTTLQSTADVIVMPALNQTASAVDVHVWRSYDHHLTEVDLVWLRILVATHRLTHHSDVLRCVRLTAVYRRGQVVRQAVLVKTTLAVVREI